MLTSSHTIILAARNNAARGLCFLTPHVESSWHGIGILNMEWAVDPLRRSWDAMPEPATQSTI